MIDARSGLEIGGRDLPGNGIDQYSAHNVNQ